MKNYHNTWLEIKVLGENCKKLGSHMSGGTDSALMTFLMAKFIEDNDLKNVKIVPVHGWDIRRQNSYSPTTVRNILNVIRPLFPTVQIDDLYIYAYNKIGGEDKSKYARPVIRLLHTENLVDVFAYGATKEPPFKDLVDLEIESLGRTEKIRDGGPMGAYTKKYVAELYEKYNLMDNLLPVTVSCIDDLPDGKPCKKCWWCKEKYWAFGRY
tara:strand:+ start:44 stop:676 length:633 start_codon:yes stop_codon:yes gene_type:complete